MSVMDAASTSVRPRTDPVSPPAVVEPSPALPGDRLARYSRQLLMPGFGEDAQRRLTNARVLVVSAGGLASASIPYLTGAGVGTIGIIDTDIVELSNLHRQISHGMRDLGRSKAHSIADTIVAIGEEVTTGQPVAECGNSGNSTQPHVHMQVMDSPDLSVARGVPMAFRRFREWPGGAKHPQIRVSGLPGESAVVERLPVLAADVSP